MVAGGVVDLVFNFTTGLTMTGHQTNHSSEQCGVIMSHGHHQSICNEYNKLGLYLVTLQSPLSSLQTNHLIVRHNHAVFILQLSGFPLIVPLSTQTVCVVVIGGRVVVVS